VWIADVVTKAKGNEVYILQLHGSYALLERNVGDENPLLFRPSSIGPGISPQVN